MCRLDKRDIILRSMPRGIWVQYVSPVNDDDGKEAFDCSVCGAMVSKPTNYCPSCGARMVEVLLNHETD